MMPRGWMLAGLVALAWVLGCSANDAGDAELIPPAGGDGTTSQSGFDNTGGRAVGGSGGSAGTGGADTALPPEVEEDVRFELPKAGERFVYVANPGSDSVAVIDAETGEIHVVEAGDQPTFLQTLAGRDEAVVLNVGSDDATVIRTAGGASTTSTVPVVRGANAIQVAPDGEHAIVYFDASLASADNASGSFQDVSVLSLAEGEESSVSMTVGFRPSGVAFSSDGTRGFVVTEDGVSVLDFEAVEQEGTGIARTVSLGENIDQRALDVSVTPDGAYALAREPGSSLVRLVALADGAIQTLDLATLLPPAAPEPGLDAGVASDAGTDAGMLDDDVSVVTDLDLSPSGDEAIAVVRERAAVLRIPLPGAFADPAQVGVTVIEGELVGSVELGPDSRYALLYTTALPSERLTVLDLMEAAPPRTVQLRKSIRAATVAPDGDNALVVHDRKQGDPNEPGITPDEKIDRLFGYSGIRLSDGFVKLQVTDIDLGPFTAVPDGSAIFILFNSATWDIREVHRFALDSFLVDVTHLNRAPTSIGHVVGSKRVFIGEDHPDGRITFIDWQSGEVQSVTGFELNSRIRD